MICELPEDINVYYKIHYLKVHQFFKIDQIEPELTMRTMNPDTVKKMLEKKPELVKHEIVHDDMVLLTAGPKELQKFLKEHANDEDFFGDAGEFERYVPDDDDDKADDDDDDEDDDEDDDDDDDDDDD